MKCKNCDKEIRSGMWCSAECAEEYYKKGNSYGYTKVKDGLNKLQRFRP